MKVKKRLLIGDQPFQHLHDDGLACRGGVELATHLNESPVDMFAQVTEFRPQVDEIRPQSVEAPSCRLPKVAQLLPNVAQLLPKVAQFAAELAHVAIGVHQRELTAAADGEAYAYPQSVAQALDSRSAAFTSRPAISPTIPPSAARITAPVPGTPSVNEPVQRMSVPPAAFGEKTTSPT